MERMGEPYAGMYAEHEAVGNALAICFMFIVYSYVWSIIGNNVSKVDQIWSITPVLYCWYFSWYYFQQSYGNVHYRLLLLSTLVSLWGARLTFNFWRKGGYGTFFTHEEDYRWPIIRKNLHPILFQLLNVTFIATYQNILLFLIAAPAYEVMRGPSIIYANDCIVAFIFAALLLMETVADEQHWIFQTYKHSLTPEARAKDPNMEIRQGFYQSGLFKYSRHPNYFAEQSMWVTVYLFSITPPGSKLVNWTITGCIQLILLFMGSMSFGESITLGKYPEYQEYQKSTSQCIPMLPRVSKPASGNGAAETKKTD